MGLSKSEAQRLKHHIGPEHLLLGLIQEGSGVAANVLKNMNIELKRIRAEIEKIVKGNPTVVTHGNLPFTPRAKKVLELAVEEASSLGHNYIGTEHLLLGLIKENEPRSHWTGGVTSWVAFSGPRKTASRSRPTSTSRRAVAGAIPCNT